MTDDELRKEVKNEIDRLSEDFTLSYLVNCGVCGKIMSPGAKMYLSGITYCPACATQRRKRLERGLRKLGKEVKKNSYDRIE